MDYPVWDLALGGGMLMAIVAIPHVIVSHFAIGGGLLIAVTETLAVKNNDPEMRELAKRSSLVLILVSTVFGAISGVGIWVVAGLISPGAISALIHTYVWGWAIEWVFFIVEIVAALVYYTTWDKISRGAHLLVIWLYFISAYLSLVIINGIITFMLTPGRWLETGAFWDGFFNPTYWPAIVLRTGICVMMGVAFLVFTAQRAKAEDRPRLMRYLGWWTVGGGLLSYAGYRWWEAALPESVRAMFDPSSPLVAGLDSTRSLCLWALAVTVIMAAVFLVAVPRAAKMPVAIVVMVASFLFFGSYERLREAVRKPFLIHSHMFSNGLRVADIDHINAQGMVAFSGWVAAAAESGELSHGAEVFRAQCKACHTRDGYLAIREQLPSVDSMIAVTADNPPGTSATVYAARCAPCHADVSAEEMREMLPTAEEMAEDLEMIADLNRGMIAATVLRLRDLGEEYTSLTSGEMASTAEFDIPYMPPFVGNEEDVEALVAYLASLAQGDPGTQGGEL